MGEEIKIFISVRMFGKYPNGGLDNAYKRAREWEKFGYRYLESMIGLEPTRYILRYHDSHRRSSYSIKRSANVEDDGNEGNMEHCISDSNGQRTLIYW